MSIFEIASSIPKYTLDYFYPILPAVKLVCSIDFGVGDQSNYPNSIHYRRINISMNNEERCGLVETASYIVNNNASSPDLSIQTNEAKDLWRRMGFGFISTGSLKEAMFLIKLCQIPSVIFVDEEFLERRINELTQKKISEPLYLVPEILSSFNLIDTCSNSHFRSWRLTKLIEKYQRLFFDYAKPKDIQDCFKAIGNLQLPPQLYIN